MEQSETPFKATEKPKKARGRRIFDIIVIVIIVIICGVLLKTLLTQLSLKHEVSSARTVSDQIINDIRKQNGQDVRAHGDKIFQAQNSAANLTTQFKAAAQVTASTPAVERQTVTNDKNQQAVSVIYKFPNKQPFYIRIIVVKPKGSDKFQIVNLKGDTTEKPLLTNKY
jgi:hypothetical protein